MAKITVYIPTHNYGKYIEKAIQSVLAQTLEDWELIIINDGSTDQTSEILKKYENHPKIQVLEQVKQGLNVSNNVALRLSNAQYLMRLDADDYLDENALLVLSNLLDKRTDIGLVYPDYYLVTEEEEVIELVRRKKINEEVHLLDLPPHGACTMIRKEYLIQLEGYSEEFSCQDGYDLWLRFLLSFKPYNVNIPLFYYRQHADSLSKNQEKILKTKSKIERNFVRKFKNDAIPNVLAIIPVLHKAPHVPESAFSLVGQKPLIWHTLKEVVKTPLLQKIVVSSNDDRIHDFCKTFNRVECIKRNPELTAFNTPLKAIVQEVLTKLKAEENYKPDAVMILYLNTPFRRKMHIERAIDVMTIFDVDSVISVTEELAHCYFHETEGLRPIQRNRDLRLEKKAIYKETGAILLSRLNGSLDKNFLGQKIGHILMLPEESLKIKSHFDLWLANQVFGKIFWQIFQKGKKENFHEKQNILAV